MAKFPVNSGWVKLLGHIEGGVTSSPTKDACLSAMGVGASGLGDLTLSDLYRELASCKWGAEDDDWRHVGDDLIHATREWELKHPGLVIVSGDSAHVIEAKKNAPPHVGHEEQYGLGAKIRVKIVRAETPQDTKEEFLGLVNKSRRPSFKRSKPVSSGAKTVRVRVSGVEKSAVAKPGQKYDIIKVTGPGNES